MGPGQMRHQGRGRGRLGRGPMGHGMMGPHMITIMIVFMDTNSDGALSLEEVQAVHARLFTYVDADKDGLVTPEEIRAFMHGPQSGPQQ